MSSSGIMKLEIKGHILMFRDFYNETVQILSHKYGTKKVKSTNKECI